MRLAEETSMMHSMPIVRIVQQMILVGAVATITVAAHPTHSAAQSGGACADSTTASAKFYRDYYRNAVSSSETHMVRFRADTGIPNISQTQVRFVGDTTACRAASVAIDARRWDKFPEIPVLVLELGTTRLVIKDVDLPGGMLNYLFNQNFSTLLKKMVF